MTSKTIYQRVPYFYIIKHLPSGEFYAGAKWGKDSNPNTFMTRSGYTTSSRKVNALIKTDGIESFEIVKILTEEDCGMGAYEYETNFLRENNCAGNTEWMNKNNNRGKFAIDNTDKVVVRSKHTREVFQTNCLSFRENRDSLEHVRADLVTARNKISGVIKTISVDYFRRNRDTWEGVVSGFVTVKNKITKRTAQISCQEFRDKPDIW
jgi:hypothetical protein